MSAIDSEKMNGFRQWADAIRDGETDFAWSLALKVRSGDLKPEEVGLSEGDLRQAILDHFKKKLHEVRSARGLTAGDTRSKAINVLCAIAVQVMVTSDWPENMRVTRHDVGLDDDAVFDLMDDFKLNTNPKLKRLLTAA